jgi:hypothetical protein
LEQLRRLDLIVAVAPIQLAIRLLVTAGSRLLDIEEVRGQIGPFDAKSLIYPWKHTVPGIDRLCEELQDIVSSAEKLKEARAAIFEKIWRAANLAAEKCIQEKDLPPLHPVKAVPYLNEPWYC